jgi:hypothetical protein
MNTTKVARLYPVYCDMLRRAAAAPQRGLLGMLENVLRAEVLQDAGHRYSIALRDQDNPTTVFNFVGVPTEDHLADFVPARVFAWAQQQLPSDLSEPTRLLAPKAGWAVRLQAAALATQGQPGQATLPAGPTVYLEHQGSAEEVAVLARGLRAHQAKRRRHARRLLAQLWAYHWRQQRAIATQGIEEKVAA